MDPNENYFLEMQFILAVRKCKKHAASTENPLLKKFWQDEQRIFIVAYREMEAINNAEVLTPDREVPVAETLNAEC